MAIFKVYLAVMMQQMKNSVAKLMSFRVNFLLNILVELASFLTAYLTVDFLFRHVTHIGAWGRSEFMVFTCWVQILSCLHTAFAAPNFWNFSAELQNGSLDYRLLRPLGSLFDTFTAFSRPATLLALPLHVGLFVYFGTRLNLTPLAWTLSVPLILLSFMVMVLVELSIAMGMFWTVRGDGMNFLRMQTQQLQHWPDFMYPQSIRRIFTYFIPALVTGSFSVRFLLDQSSWLDIGVLALAAIVLWKVVGELWKLGLKRYESASS